MFNTRACPCYYDSAERDTPPLTTPGRREFRSVLSLQPSASAALVTTLPYSRIQIRTQPCLPRNNLNSNQGLSCVSQFHRSKVVPIAPFVMSSLGLRSLRPLFLRHLAYKAAPSIVGNVTLHRLNTMSRDVSHFSDISKSKTEPDGSFKRAPSSFRNFIQVGGQFPPEKGTSISNRFLNLPLNHCRECYRSLSSLRVLCVSYVSW